MNKIILPTLIISGLLTGASTLAFAAPVAHLVGRDAIARVSNVDRVDYTWNHHRYKHRSWDKKARHWHYY
jgi:hypothetical protein